MINPIGQAITFAVFFTEAKLGKDGLTVTADVYKDTVKIVTDGSATGIGGGLYKYELASGSVDVAANYYAIFKTATATVDFQHIPALWIVGTTWVERIDENVSAAKTLADGAITAAKIASSAITSAKFAADAITASVIQDGAITAAKLAADAITAAKVAADVGTEIASAVWAAATRTLSSFGTLAADVWASATRTLTQSAASVTATVSGSDITVRRGDSGSIALTGLGSLVGYTSLWVTVKKDSNDPDADAILQFKKNASGTGDGLLYQNGAAAADATKGAIAISDEANGSINITYDKSIADDFVPAGNLDYDVQVLNAGIVTTITQAKWNITADFTRAIA